MRKFYAFLLMLLLVTNVYSTDYTFSGTGNYTTGTWSPSYPGATIGSSDKVIIASGASVTIDDFVTINGEFENNGTVNFSSFLVLSSGATFRNSGTLTGTLSNMFTSNNSYYIHDQNGGTIYQDLALEKSGMITTITGVTNTSPTISENQFFNIVIDCSSLTTDITIGGNKSIGGSLTVTNTNTGSLTWTSDANQSTITGNLSVSSNGKMVLNPGAKLNVTGTVNSAETDCIVLKSSSSSFTGSLIASNNYLGTVQRYIGHGRWYMFGPGTTNATSNDVSGAYLQYYTQSSDSWTYVTQTDYSLTQGFGYAYYKSSSAVNSFSGTVRGTSLTMTNLPYTGAGQAASVVSNPFPNAITWDGSESYSLNDIQSVIYIYTGSQWQPQTNPVTLTAQQGFAVIADDGTNSFVFPIDKRIHDGSSGLSKSVNTGLSHLYFSVVDDIEMTDDRFYISYDDNATENYDLQYDGKLFRSGESCGNLYTTTDDGIDVSLNTEPTIDQTVVYPLYFKKGDAASYTLTLYEIENMDQFEIILEDLVTNQMITLEEDSEYKFDVSENADFHRFNLHVNTSNSILNTDIVNEFESWSFNSSVYIKNNSNKIFSTNIYDVSGRLIYSRDNVSSTLERIELDRDISFYVVQVITDDNTYTESIIIN